MQRIFNDVRNIATFIAALSSLLASKSVHLSEWIHWMPENTKAGSRLRRFTRWLSNSSIDPHAWFAAIFLYAMREWTRMPIFLALDTSMLHDRFCCVRISMIYMNRAIPVAWCVLEHNSASVKYKQYAQLFDHIEALLPHDIEIFFLADRGFVQTPKGKRPCVPISICRILLEYCSFHLGENVSTTQVTRFKR